MSCVSKYEKLIYFTYVHVTCKNIASDIDSYRLTGYLYSRLDETHFVKNNLSHINAKIQCFRLWITDRVLGVNFVNEFISYKNS